MTLYEKLMKLPLWKALMLVIFVGFLFMVVIEDLVIGRVFSIMNGMITRFEKVDKEEQKNWDSYEKSYAEFDKKWHDDFKRSWKEQDEESRKNRVIYICGQIKDVEAANKFLAKITDPNYKKPKDEVIGFYEEDEMKRLKEETPRREKEMKMYQEMLASNHASEKDCAEITE